MDEEVKDLKEIEKQTKSVYENIANEYDLERGRSFFEKEYIDYFLNALPKKSLKVVEILDLGCGSGEPIAKYLIEKGGHITGLDYSEPMLEICRKRFPEHRWVLADMRKLSLSQTYDGIISWGAFFHLNQDEQRVILPRLCQYLRPGGVLMITVGHEEGEVFGIVANEAVYHSSLSKDEYTRILKKQNMSILKFNLQDPDCQNFSVFVARKNSI